MQYFYIVTVRCNQTISELSRWEPIKKYFIGEQETGRVLSYVFIECIQRVKNTGFSVKQIMFKKTGT